jgi:hypothetical protein
MRVHVHVHQCDSAVRAVEVTVFVCLCSICNHVGCNICETRAGKDATPNDGDCGFSLCYNYNRLSSASSNHITQNLQTVIILYIISLFTKTLKSPTCFSLKDHLQGARPVPSWLLKFKNGRKTLVKKVWQPILCRRVGCLEGWMRDWLAITYDM